jgi:LuxR family maltose regulon positive regulatory protein
VPGPVTATGAIVPRHMRRSDAGAATPAGRTVTLSDVETKLTPPPRPRHHVARPRVTACLAPRSGTRVALVTGPPGAGKTTAVHEWIVSTGRGAAWLTLDAQDDRPSVFWRDVLASLRHAAPELERRPAPMHAGPSQQRVSVEQVLGEMAALADGVVLVLDDFHLVTNRTVLRELQMMLERKPPTAHVVIVSRSEPLLPVARWRVRDELVEVRKTDLEFQPAEVHSYLSTFDDLELDEHTESTLARRTEGWIAGLQLAVASLRSTDDPAGFVESFSGTDRYVADFLRDEVLARQPRDVRDFLLETSVLSSLDAALCEAVTGRHDVEAQLRRLEAMNLFLVGLDAAGTTFRYHTLFRDLLGFELERREPERSRAVREKAARHLARAGDTLAAAELFTQAGREKEAFSLATPRQLELAPHTRADASAHLDLISPAFVARDRGRSLVYADALRKVGRSDEGAAWLERACTTSARRPLDRRDHARSEAIWTSWFAAEGDGHAAVRHGDRALRLTSRRERRDDPLLQSLGIELARAWMLLGRPGHARRALAGLTSGADPVTDEVVAPAVRARIEACEGQLREAETNAERALRMATALDVEGCPATIDALLARASVRRERDDLVRAATDVDGALAGAGALSSRPYRLLARLEEVRNVEATLGPDHAIEKLEAARAEYGDPMPLGLADAVEMLGAVLSLRVGNIEHAARVVAKLPVSVEREILVVAVEIGSGEWAQARARLASLLPVQLVHRISVELLRGMTAHDLADLRRHVALAAELAAPEGFRRLFAQNGPAVARALRSLATSSDLHPLAVDLVGAVVDLPAVRTGALMVEPLSQREESVLRYFPTSLTYHDIATELLISVNTLKTHVKNIHRKLGVSSRMEAVAQARQLGMLNRTPETRTVTG